MAAPTWDTTTGIQALTANSNGTLTASWNTAGSGVITFPTVNYNGGTGRYDATVPIITYSGTDYNDSIIGSSGSKYTLWVGLGVNSKEIGTASAANNPEPQDLLSVDDMDFDGTTDIDIILANNGALFATFINSNVNTAANVAALPGIGYTIDLVITSVFTQNGAGSNYTFNGAAITSAGAALWGGDGAGGERTTGAIADVRYRMYVRQDSAPDAFTVSGVYYLGETADTTFRLAAFAEETAFADGDNVYVIVRAANGADNAEDTNVTSLNTTVTLAAAGAGGLGANLRGGLRGNL